MNKYIAILLLFVELSTSIAHAQSPLDFRRVLAEDKAAIAYHNKSINDAYNKLKADRARGNKSGTYEDLEQIKNSKDAIRKSVAQLDKDVLAAMSIDPKLLGAEAFTLQRKWTVHSGR